MTNEEEKNKQLTLPEETKGVSNDDWPTPKWLVKDSSATDHKEYDSYLIYNLRTRYYEIECDFKLAYYSLLPPSETDSEIVKRIVKLLGISRQALEGKEVDLLTVANLLDLAERSMIWLFPLPIVKKRVSIRAKHLESTYPEYAKILSDEIDKINNDPSEDGFATLKASYDEVVGEINKHYIEDQISFGLQIERLELLRAWGLLSLFVAAFALPLLINFNGLNVADALGADSILTSVSQMSPYLLGLALTIVFSIMGALGGFMSGLLQIRNTKVNLIEFRESLLKFQLKPIVGGLTAVLITVLLSWQILPGINIESMGSFILLSFLTGFSERYFLKLLQVDEEPESFSIKNESKIGMGGDSADKPLDA